MGAQSDSVNLASGQVRKFLQHSDLIWLCVCRKLLMQSGRYGADQSNWINGISVEICRTSCQVKQDPTIFRQLEPAVKSQVKPRS